MSVVKQIELYNRKFVKQKKYEPYLTDVNPNKRLAILTCMDARLTELLPAALDIKNGDAMIIKNAGGIITHPFGSIMRSLLMAIYELDVEEIMVIGHFECGMRSLNGEKLIEKMEERGVSRQNLEVIDYCGINMKRWLTGFGDEKTSVRKTMEIINNHPLMPKGVRVHGYIINPTTGLLTKVEPLK